MSPDIIGGDLSNPQSLNRYTYALNNPLTLTDPSGFDPDDPDDEDVQDDDDPKGQTPTVTIYGCGGPGCDTGEQQSVGDQRAQGQAFGGQDCGLCDGEAPVQVDGNGPSFGVTAAQTALDAAGLIPGPIGMIANVASAGISLSEGNYLSAGLSLAFAVPVIGQFGAEAHAGFELGEGGFRSFDAFKRAYPAAAGMTWHHIVEQTPGNLARFGPSTIHNVENLVQVPANLHIGKETISAYYSSKDVFTGGQTVRKWLASQAFQDQFDFGMQELRSRGIIQ